MYIQKVIHVHI